MLLNAPLTQFFQHHYCSAVLTFWGSVAGRWSGSRFLLIVSALPNILSNDVQKSVFISFVHYNQTTWSFFSLFPHLQFMNVHASFSHLILSSSTYILPKVAYDTLVLHLIWHIMFQSTTKPIYSSIMTTLPISCTIFPTSPFLVFFPSKTPQT